MWLQETGDWGIVPDLIMKGPIDLVGPFRIGAVNHHGLFQPSHTICLWWASGKLNRESSGIIQNITGIERPGNYRGAVLWTTNSHHKLTIESPLVVRKVSTELVFTSLHILWDIETLGVSGKEVLRLLSNRAATMEDIMNPNAHRYFSSLKKADAYRQYGSLK